MSQSAGLDQKTVYALIARVAGQANVLTIPRLFIDWTGDHISALLLSQIIYWSSRTTDAEGWFYKSAKEWEEELGISDYQLTRATKKLADAGVATKLRKVRGAPTLHYRLDRDTFLDWISDKLGNGFSAPAGGDSRESRKWISDSSGSPFPTNSAMHSRVTRESLTETTTETTTERPVEASTGQPPKLIRFGDREVVSRYVTDLARELNDQAPLSSSVTRACNLYVDSGRPLDEFCQLLLEARRRTQEHSGTIRQPLKEGGLSGLTKPKMGYYFAVLEDLLARQEQSAD
jgi:hypothetical protein